MEFQAPATESGGSVASLIVSGGYASDFIFRGREFGTGMGEGRAECVFPVGDSASFSIGGKYAASDDYEEAQGFASLQQALGPITAALGYRYYGLDADDRQEVGFLIGSVLGGFDFSLAYYYDARMSGHYVELLSQRTWQVFEHLGVRTGAGISAASNYWYGESGMNNAVFRVDLPVNLRDWATLTPWVSVSLPMEALDDYSGDAVFGGVSLQLSF